MVAAPKQNRPVADLDPSASLDEMKEKIEEVQKQVEGEAPADDPRHKKEYVFNFEHERPDGTKEEGRFANQILTIGQKQQVSMMTAQMLGGADLSSIDDDTLELTRAIAHLTFSLNLKPKWADDLREEWDDNLVLRLYGEVISHEARFRRLV